MDIQSFIHQSTELENFIAQELGKKAYKILEQSNLTTYQIFKHGDKK